MFLPIVDYQLDAGSLLRMEEFLENRVRRYGILQWPDQVLPHAKAGIIRLLPGFRYLLIIPILVEQLSPSELKSWWHINRAIFFRGIFFSLPWQCLVSWKWVGSFW